VKWCEEVQTERLQCACVLVELGGVARRALPAHTRRGGAFSALTDNAQAHRVSYGGTYHPIRSQSSV